MPSYGYTIHQFQVHPHGKPDEALRLGTLEAPDVPGDAGTDALDVLYGLLYGMVGHPVADRADSTRRLELTSVHGVGRCVRFSGDLGRSGQESQIIDPGDGSTFQRTSRHIENVARRGLLVVPDHSTAGLLIVEAYGRTTGRRLLADDLKRTFRSYTERILDFLPAVDSKALAAYLEQAKINAIRLRRYKLPSDVADQLEMEGDQVDAGELDTFVRGPIKRTILNRLQHSEDARRRMLVIGGTEYNEASVQVQVGSRPLTVDITSDRAPKFITVIGPRRPTDEQFYAEVTAAIPDMAPGVNVRLAHEWATKPWSDEQRQFMIERRTVVQG